MESLVNHVLTLSNATVFFCYLCLAYLLCADIHYKWKKKMNLYKQWFGEIRGRSPEMSDAEIVTFMAGKDYERFYHYKKSLIHPSIKPLK